MYDARAWRKRRTFELAAHRARHGDRCPGFGVPPHASSDLTERTTPCLSRCLATSGSLTPVP